VGGGTANIPTEMIDDAHSVNPFQIAHMNVIVGGGSGSSEYLPNEGGSQTYGKKSVTQSKGKGGSIIVEDHKILQEVDGHGNN